SSLRFDHLTLCTFNGHSSSVRRIASLSNENSFISASSDKTVKLWSIKPEYDTVEAQWTYNRHQRPILDVTLLANNLIASTDGHLHVWDPFRGAIITQLDWDGDARSVRLSCGQHQCGDISSHQFNQYGLIDTRTGNWTSELKVSNLPGLTRAFSVRESGQKMVVALSNGTIVLLDARTGRLASLSHGNSTHATAYQTNAKVGVEWRSGFGPLVQQDHDGSSGVRGETDQLCFGVFSLSNILFFLISN
ncbi:WD domain, G-beta repeat protein, partial [Cooperia oncophora]